MAVDLSEVEEATDNVTPAADSVEPAGVTHPWLRRVGIHLGVIAVFTLPAVVLWWRAWNNGAASTVRCTCLDPAQQVWFIAWPAHALANLLSPFSSTWLWPPHGVNLLANASAPLVGIVLSPVTWWFGPLTATTLALTLAPGLSAWGCWVACRRLVTWRPAWWVAGFVFGYSPFVVQSVAQGHLSTGLLVIPPLVLVALHEIMVRQRASVWWSGISLAALLLAQFLISAEVLTMLVVLGVVGIVVTIALNPHRVAAQLPYALRAFGVAGVTSLVLLAAPVAYMLAGPQRIKGPVWAGLHTIFVAQAFSLWDPGTYRGPLWSEALQGPPLQFLGFGLLIVLAASVVVAWRRRSMWVLAIVALVATVFSWGGILFLSPNHPIYSDWLPWSHLTNLPVLDNITTLHFAAFADLGAALIIAIGLDTLRWSRPGQWLPAAGRIAVLVGATDLRSPVGSGHGQSPAVVCHRRTSRPGGVSGHFVPISGVSLAGFSADGVAVHGRNAIQARRGVYQGPRPWRRRDREGTAGFGHQNAGRSDLGVLLGREVHPDARPSRESPLCPTNLGDLLHRRVQPGSAP